jgi:membrane dipeptidase
MKIQIQSQKVYRKWPFAILIGIIFLWSQFHCLKKPYGNDAERAEYLLQNYPLVDTHNDLPWTLRGKNIDLNLTSVPDVDTDLIRMQKGHLTAQIWSAYIPCESKNPVVETLEQIDLIKKMIAKNPELTYVDRAAKILSAFESKKIPSLIGIEGGHQIDSSLAVLRQYYDLGVRYMTLTHVCHTPWADSCAPEPVHDGLTDLGKDIVKEMNLLGMMVDISHVSHKVMQDVVQLSKAPLFASHSSAFALCPTTRNMPDEILEAMKVKDGVIMINFWPALISCSHTSTIDQVLDHIDHVRKVAGYQHVGFGGDFDGITEKTTGMEDVSSYPVLIHGMIKRGYSDDEITSIMGGNLIRVLKKTEKVAHQLQKHL